MEFKPFAGPQWTRARLVAAIQRFHAENGRAPKHRDWKRSGEYWPTADTVVRHFGRWNDALVAAGFAAHAIGKAIQYGPDATIEAGGVRVERTRMVREFIGRDKSEDERAALNALPLGEAIPAAGFSRAQVSRGVGISHGYLNDMIADPDLSKRRARQALRSPGCKSCGGRVSELSGGGWADVCKYCKQPLLGVNPSKARWDGVKRRRTLAEVDLMVRADAAYQLCRETSDVGERWSIFTALVWPREDVIFEEAA